MAVVISLDTKKLDELIAKTPARASEIVRQTAFRILTSAREVTPRDPARPPKDPERQVTGALRANSDVVVVSPYVSNVEYYQEYAPYQELGAPAINLPARPFLTPAVEKHAKQFEDDIKKELIK